MWVLLLMMVYCAVVLLAVFVWLFCLASAANKVKNKELLQEQKQYNIVWYNQTGELVYELNTNMLPGMLMSYDKQESPAHTCRITRCY